MKKYRITIVLGIIFVIGILSAACAKYDNKATTAVNESSYVYDEAEAPKYDADMADFNNVTGLTSTTELVSGNTADLSMDKIITKVNLEVETQDFDELINVIKDEISRLGGYDERTDISGKRYYSRGNLRYGYIVARIPKDRLKEFVEIVKENGNVINESSSSDNVTLQYVDTQSRKKSLEIEQERLWSLLEKAEKLEDIVTLESRLSSIRHELQMYETELRTIDNQVDYSTVTININEVERMSPSTEEKETVFTRIKNGFSKSMYDISEGLKDFFVWFVVSLPYLLIWAVIIIVVVIISRKTYKRISKKREVNPNPGTKENPPIE